MVALTSVNFELRVLIDSLGTSVGDSFQHFLEGKHFSGVLVGIVPEQFKNIGVIGSSDFFQVDGNLTRVLLLSM